MARKSDEISDWKKRLNASVPVSVNVSQIDLYDPDLTDRLLGILKENDLKVEELLLEITESAYTENSEHIDKKVEKLLKASLVCELTELLRNKTPGDYDKLHEDILKETAVLFTLLE